MSADSGCETGGLPCPVEYTRTGAATHSVAKRMGVLSPNLVRATCSRVLVSGKTPVKGDLHLFLSGSDDEVVNLILYEGGDGKTQSRHIRLNVMDWMNLVDEVSELLQGRVGHASSKSETG